MITAKKKSVKAGRAAVLTATAAACAAALAIAGCSSSSSSSTPSSSGSSSAASSGSSSSSGSGTAPSLTIKDLSNTFSAMASLKPLAAKGKGSIEVILPDTTTSARYTEFDAPYLTKAFQTAGVPSSDFTVQNAQGSDTTQFNDAQNAITKGATVLVVDPLDSTVGARIESYAKSHGVAVIDYDRITSNGSRDYYVSFNNVQVGKLIGQGFVTCASSWGVTKPDVVVMKGSPTDNNATLFAEGYNGVLNPYFSSGKYVKAATPAGTWTPNKALSEFEQAYTAHKGINSLVSPNDENAAPIIHYLKQQGIKPKTFPVTGQDATLVGLQNILSGYQCGTVYKPIYEEAEATAALAVYLRAGVKAPAGLVNGSTKDPGSGASVPSVLLTPEWVTTSNMNSTVIADNFVKASALCTSAYANDCKNAGISG